MNLSSLPYVLHVPPIKCRGLRSYVYGFNERWKGKKNQQEILVRMFQGKLQNLVGQTEHGDISFT